MQQKPKFAKMGPCPIALDEVTPVHECRMGLGWLLVWTCKNTIHQALSTYARAHMAYKMRSQSRTMPFVHPFTLYLSLKVRTLGPSALRLGVWSPNLFIQFKLRTSRTIWIVVVRCVVELLSTSQCSVESCSSRVLSGTRSCFPHKPPAWWWKSRKRCEVELA